MVVLNGGMITTSEAVSMRVVMQEGQNEYRSLMFQVQIHHVTVEGLFKVESASPKREKWQLEPP